MNLKKILDKYKSICYIKISLRKMRKITILSGIVCIFLFALSEKINYLFGIDFNSSISPVVSIDLLMK